EGAAGAEAAGEEVAAPAMPENEPAHDTARCRGQGSFGRIAAQPIVKPTTFDVQPLMLNGCSEMPSAAACAFSAICCVICDGTVTWTDTLPLASVRPSGSGRIGIARPSVRLPPIGRCTVVVPVFSATMISAIELAVAPVTAMPSWVPAAPLPVMASEPQFWAG